MSELPNGLPTLSAGFHRPGEGKACVMEYVSLLAGEEWTDTPACTNLVLARAAQAVNDGLRDDERHLLVPLIGRLFGTDAPVDNRLLVLWCARSVEHLSETAKACNDITARFILGDASAEELRTNAADAADASYAYAAACAPDAAYAAAGAASAADAACAPDAAYDSAAAAAYAAAAAAADAAYAVKSADADSKVTWLSGLIDEYDRLAGRTETVDVTDADLARLAAAVSNGGTA